MKDNSAWRYFREPYEQKVLDKVQTFFRSTVRREDGFTMVVLPAWKQDQFLCTGDFGEFRFIAKRKEMPDSTPLGQYIVCLDEFDPKWPGDKEQNKALCLEHLKDIEDALLHFPLVFYFDYRPEESYSIFNDKDTQSPAKSDALGVAKALKSIINKLRFLIVF